MLCMALVSWLPAAAQYYFAEEHWHNGYILLNDGDTLRGRLRFSLENELLQFDLGNGQLQALNARSVLFFEIFDQYFRQKRQFIVLPFAKNPAQDYESPTIFEVLATGDYITLLGRERLVTQTATVTSPYVIGPIMTVRRPKFEYYFLYKNGSIRFYGGDRKDITQYLPGMDERLQNFIRQNRLNPDEPADLVKIVNYYNQAIR